MENIRTALESYYTMTYTFEMQEELNRTTQIFDLFNYSKPYEVMEQTFFDPELEDPDILNTLILSHHTEGLRQLLDRHNLTIDPDASLYELNELLLVIVRIPHYEDKTAILRLLDTDLEDEVIFTKILENFTTIPQVRWMEIVTLEDDAILSAIRNLYEDTVEEPSVAPPPAALVIQLKSFLTLFGEGTLAHQLVSNDFRIGERLSTYYPYVKDILMVGNPSQVAQNFLSLFLISIDGYEDPAGVFRKVSDRFFDSLEAAGKVEAEIFNMVKKLKQQEGAQDVARGVSPTVHQT